MKRSGPISTGRTATTCIGLLAAYLVIAFVGIDKLVRCLEFSPYACLGHITGKLPMQVTLALVHQKSAYLGIRVA